LTNWNELVLWTLGRMCDNKALCQQQKDKYHCTYCAGDLKPKCTLYAEEILIEAVEKWEEEKNE